jgi:heptosyltransferase-2
MRKILIRSPNWIGDQIMAYPFFKNLRQQYPHAWIAVVCNEWVRDIQFRGFVDEVFVIQKKKDDGVFASIQKIRQLAERIRQRGPWDLGITLPNSFGSALLLYLSKATIRRGYDTDLRGFLLNQKIKWNPSSEIHRVEAFGNLLLSKDTTFRLRDYWQHQAEHGGEKNFDPILHWPDVVPLEPPTGHYAVIAPGAVANSRRWSAAQYAELIDLIYDRYGLKSVIVGGAAEKEIAESFVKQDLPVIDYTSKGWVSSLWKVFKNAKFTIGNESGLAHVASFCGSPMYIICGAADPKRTQPIGPGIVKVKVNPIECWPCERNECELPGELKNRCLKEISASSVLEDLA